MTFAADDLLRNDWDMFNGIEPYDSCELFELEERTLEDVDNVDERELLLFTNAGAIGGWKREDPGGATALCDSSS